MDTTHVLLTHYTGTMRDNVLHTGTKHAHVKLVVVREPVAAGHHFALTQNVIPRLMFLVRTSYHQAGKTYMVSKAFRGA